LLAFPDVGKKATPAGRDKEKMTSHANTAYLYAANGSAPWTNFSYEAEFLRYFFRAPYKKHSSPLELLDRLIYKLFYYFF
jgi:hypothetical protein